MAPTDDTQAPSAAQPGELLKIGQVAEMAGTTLRTIRFYEEEGLLVPASRSAGGYRLYTEDQVERLRLLMQMKPLGFSVDEKRKLLDAVDRLHAPNGADTETARETVREFTQRTTASIAALREQLEHAESFHELLRKLQIGD